MSTAPALVGAAGWRRRGIVSANFAALSTAKGRYDLRSSHVNTSGGNITSFIDGFDGSLAPVTGVLPAPTADAALAGALTCEFGSTVYAVSARTPASFKYASDGTGSSSYYIFVPAYLVGAHHPLSNRSLSGAAGDTGFGFHHIQDVPGASVTSDGVNVWSASGGTMVLGTPVCLQAHWQKSASPEYLVYKDSAIIGSGTAGTPNAGNPSQPLCLTVPGTTFAGRFWGALGFTYLTPPERAIVASYVFEQTRLVIA